MSFKIEWVGTPNFNEGRKGHKPIAIVNHITAGQFPGCLNWLQNPKSEGSSNYLTTRTGRILCLVKDENTAWANGGINKPNWKLLKSGISPNRYTISIEHEGYKTNGGDGKLTDVQLEATIWLHKVLTDKWKIPIDTDHIIGHYRIDSVSRANCPGKNFPWEKLLKGLKGSEVDMALLDWQRKGGLDAIDYLAKHSLINSPDTWKDDEKLEAPVEGYLFFMMMKRLHEQINSK